MADPVLGPTEDGDLFKVTLNQTLYGQKLMNVLWYKAKDVPDPAPDRWAAMIGLANQLNAAGNLIPTMAEAVVHRLTFTTVKVNTYRTIETRLPYAEIVVNVEGDIVEESGDANTAASIEKRAWFESEHPRQGIGRMQLAGMPLGGYSAGVFDVEQMALLQAVADQLTEDVAAVGVTFKPVLVTKAALEFIPHDIFGAIAKSTVRTQRTRTVGVGE